jgi:hypothetical protein
MLIVQEKIRSEWTDCDADGFETIEGACRWGIENLVNANEATYGVLWRVQRVITEVMPFAAPSAW